MLDFLKTKNGFTIYLGLALCLSACETETSVSRPESSGTIQPAELTPATAAATITAPALESNSFVLGPNLVGELFVHSISDSSSFILNNDEDYVNVADIAGDYYAIAAEDNSFNLIDRATGEVSWSAFLDDNSHLSVRHPSSPVCDGSVCYIMSTGGRLMELDINLRKANWDTELYPLVNDRSLVVSSLLVNNDWVVAGFFAPQDLFTDGAVPGRFVVADRRDGRVVREFNTVPFGTPQLAEGVILLPGFDELVAIDAVTLDPLWRFNQFSDTPAIVNGIAVVSSTERNNNNDPVPKQVLVGLDLKTGEQLWRREAGTLTARHHPTTDGRLVYAKFGLNCSFEAAEDCLIGNPMAIDPVNGSVIWINEDIIVTYSPAVTAGAIFYTTDGDRLIAALDSSNGSIVWSIEAGTSRPWLNWLTIVSGERIIRNNHFPQVYR